jgi:hypothetical protein
VVQISRSVLPNNVHAMNKDFTSVRMVYLLIAMVLLLGAMAQSWEVVVFIVVMLLFAFFTGKCPSKWLFEKLGYKKVDL